MSESDNCSTTPPSPDGYTSALFPQVMPSMALDAAGLPPLQPTPPQQLQCLLPLFSPESLDGYMLQPPTPYSRSPSPVLMCGNGRPHLPPPHQLFSPESNDVYIPQPPTLYSRSPSPVRMCGMGARRQC